ncbi:MAG: ribosome biogenesis GTPase Der [Acidimicrobiia bacterium]|nr:ribosome biogenesis GTPase Der [Acidimicrobiia bacterium]
MSRLPLVAVVGRPNVGKSTLVNRIVGRRLAVVEAKAGVTRDRKEIPARWNERDFIVVDTGGWELTPSDDLVADIRGQAEIAIAAADVIVFVVDAQTGITADDAGVVEMLRQASVPVVVAANKVDGSKHDHLVTDLWSAGLGEPIGVSALHGRGSGDLLDRVVKLLPPKDDERDQEPVATLAILGRPNVGKSTLLNQLAGEERVLVSPVAGTTRDPIDVVVDMDGEPFRVVDTAGIRRRAVSADKGADFYSIMRARKALTEADVALLIIDGHEGATFQDQRLAQEVADSGAGLVILANKWDEADADERAETLSSIGDRLAFAHWAPVLTMSAKTGSKIGRIGGAVRLALENRRKRIPTGELNRLMRQWQQMHPPPVRKGRRPKILYAVQSGIEPPDIVLMISGGELGADYLRYLEGKVREHDDYTATPVWITPRSRQSQHPRS